MRSITFFFGLSLEASDKDVDNAYRKKARQMHPDKNGGTDEAKKRFQEMKERYEELKKKRSAVSTPSSGEAAEPQRDTQSPKEAQEDADKEGERDASAQQESGGARQEDAPDSEGREGDGAPQ